MALLLDVELMSLLPESHKTDTQTIMIIMSANNVSVINLIVAGQCAVGTCILVNVSLRNKIVPDYHLLDQMTEENNWTA